MRPAFLVLCSCFAVASVSAQVKDQEKISDTEGSFVGDLDNTDFFSRGTVALGDLDGDDVIDLAVGAPGDDDGGANRGAVWVLFLNANGTVKSHQKISDTEGGFVGTLNDNDFFGHSLTSLGDLDGDDITDLAVGANGLGSVHGSVWILFMNANGTVKSHQEISNTAGNFTGTLNGSQQFGDSLASLGDLDGDDVVDLAVGASGDGDGGQGRGAIWILFLNADGTVKDHQKISDTAGGFTGVLDNIDGLAVSMSALGDLDGDEITDLAVGASGDDDGGDGRGAVWILFLNADGTVKDHQKISDTAGNFTGTLENTDIFGQAVAALGDLDGDDVTELAVAATLDDDGGSGRGAVWILFLNADGTVKDHQKISDTAGGFTGTLANNDFLGVSIALLGDLDTDGTSDFAVGSYSDDGGTDRGAVWILFGDGAALPVELIDFTATTYGDRAHLAWQTASEVNNAGFQVEHSTAPSNWTAIGFTPGQGTTLQAQQYAYTVEDLAPGQHRFRLKQLDYDGTFAYSPEVEVTVEMVEAFVLSDVYPNPFNPEASVTLSVRERQAVTVTVHDLLGREVTRLYDGELAAQQSQVLQLNGMDWPSGLYVLRVVGERFSASQTLTLLK